MSGKEKQGWNELPQRQRIAIVVAGVVQVGLTVAALVDLRRRPARRIRGEKRLWRAASFVNFAGPIAYFTLGRK